MTEYMFFWREYDVNGGMIHDGWAYCNSGKEVLDYFEEYKDTKYESWVAPLGEYQLMDSDCFKAFLKLDLEG